MTVNAAVGVAQLRKLDAILETQRRNKSVLKSALSRFPEIRFREIPDPAGDSATFLSFMLPNADRTRRVAADLAKAGVDGCFYWFDNNWHYLRNWPHLKGLRAPAPLAQALSGSCPDYETLALPRSDEIVSRTISMQIRLSWSEAELDRRIAALETVFTGK